MDDYSPFVNDDDDDDTAAWAKMLDDKRLKEEHRRYYDRWNWETGDPKDYKIFTIFEKEIQYRQSEQEAMDRISKELSGMDIFSEHVYDLFDRSGRQEPTEQRRNKMIDILKKMSDKVNEG